MPLSAAGAASAAGLLLGWSLVVAFGPQNLFVLRQGMARRHVGLVVAICAASDAALIAAGVAGPSALLRRDHSLLVALRLGGAALLAAYGAAAVRRARRGLAPRAGCASERAGRGSTAAACLGFTWLNPAAYLDTVVVIGTIAGTWGGRRWWFAAGAVLASVVWFGALGFGSRLLSPLLASPACWRVLDAVTALAMTFIGVRLVAGL
ncbi:MAG TPA: LysE family transporter [Acidimicrobiales bacterium]|nr:LysE family transporter [Acidimicrobiales bacterium]